MMRNSTVHFRRPGTITRAGIFVIVAGAVAAVMLVVFLLWISIPNRFATMPPFHAAVEAGDLDKVKSMLNQGYNVNQSGLQGTTPLFFANTVDMAQVLISRGANINASSDYRATPLHFAAGRGNSGVVALLVKNGAQVGAKDSDGETPLHWATQLMRDPDEGVHAVRGPTDPELQRATVRVLLQSGTNVNAQSTSGKTPLFNATSPLNQDLKIVKFLLDFGADPNLAQTDGYTPLHNAVTHPEIARLLLQSGAKVNPRGYFADTPLHYAADHGSLEVIQLLLDHGADVNARNRQNETPLVKVGPGKPEVAKILMEHGGTK